MSKRIGIADGLDALLNISKKISHDELTSKANDSLIQDLFYISVNKIRPSDNQPRRHFDETALKELAESIKTHGIIQPIIVKKVDDHYEIVVGERRWRAAKSIGLTEIPAIVRDYDKKSNCIAIALIENIQRENLNPLEEAHAIQQLIEEHSMTHAEVAENLGRSRAAVSNILRLLQLENEVKAMVNSKLLEMGHARALLGLSGMDQINAAKQVIARSLSVRDTERLVQRIDEPSSPEPVTIDPSFQQKANEWKHRFSKRLSSKVHIHFGAEGKGRVVIHFDSQEEADWLMQNLDTKE